MVVGYSSMLRLILKAAKSEMKDKNKKSLNRTMVIIIPKLKCGSIQSKVSCWICWTRRESKKSRMETNKIIDLILSSLKFLKSFSLLFRLLFETLSCWFRCSCFPLSTFSIHFNQHQMTSNKRQQSQITLVHGVWLWLFGRLEIGWIVLQVL